MTAGVWYKVSCLGRHATRQLTFASPFVSAQVKTHSIRQYPLAQNLPSLDRCLRASATDFTFQPTAEHFVEQRCLPLGSSRRKPRLVKKLEQADGSPLRHRASTPLPSLNFQWPRDNIITLSEYRRTKENEGEDKRTQLLILAHSTIRALVSIAAI